jgi:hypothetical protein
MERKREPAVEPAARGLSALELHFAAGCKWDFDGSFALGCLRLLGGRSAEMLMLVPSDGGTGLSWLRAPLVIGGA